MKLNQFDTERIYEWYLALTQAMGKPCCEHCEEVIKKIEKSLGKESVKEAEDLVKRYPYFKDGKIIKRK